MTNRRAIQGNPKKGRLKFLLSALNKRGAGYKNLIYSDGKYLCATDGYRLHIIEAYAPEDIYEYEVKKDWLELISLGKDFITHPCSRKIYDGNENHERLANIPQETTSVLMGALFHTLFTQYQPYRAEPISFEYKYLKNITDLSNEWDIYIHPRHSFSPIIFDKPGARALLMPIKLDKGGY